MAIEDLLAYQTLKVVRIKDARLGATYYALIILIAFFVVGYEILYSNNHFERRDVSGTVRLALQHPTSQHCNPKKRDCKSNYTSMDQLPYCSEYKGNSTAVPMESRRPCVFEDSDSLFPQGHEGARMLVPTRVVTTTERRKCYPGDNKCENEWERGEDDTKYIADIERYSILIQHSVVRDSISGNNDAIQGWYQLCADAHLKSLGTKILGVPECQDERRLPIECIDESCRFLPLVQEEEAREEALADAAAAQASSSDSGVALSEQRRSRVSRASLAGARRAAAASTSPWRKATTAAAAGATARGRRASGGSRGGGLQRSSLPLDGRSYLDDGVYAIPEGDVFTVGKLLSLAGVSSLDLGSRQVNETYRHAGTVVNIDVTYSNLVPFKSTFGGADLTYQYHVTLKPMTKVSDHFIKWAPVDSDRRVLERRSGVLFVVNIQGQLGFPSVVNTLLMLAEAASMLALATLLTDKIAINFMERANLYYDSKYQETLVS